MSTSYGKTFLELAGRYTRVFLNSWKIRKRLDKVGGFTVEEAEFLPAALAVQYKPISPSIRYTVSLLCGLALVGVLWAWFSHTEIVVTAYGRVLPNKNSSPVSSIEPGIVKAIFARDGSHVSEGDILLEFDSGVAESELQKAAAMATIYRSQIEVARALKKVSAGTLGAVPIADQKLVDERQIGARESAESKYRELLAKLRRIDAEIASHENSLAREQFQLAVYSELYQSNDISRQTLSEHQRVVAEHQRAIANSQRERDVQIKQFDREASDMQLEALRALQVTNSDIEKHTAIVQRGRVIAPVSGTVQQMIPSYAGQVINPSVPLLTIVPDGALMEFEAKILSKDMGFVKRGQAVTIKIDALDSNGRKGNIMGTVRYISNEAIADEKLGQMYIVRGAIDALSSTHASNEGALQAGMSLRAEIITGRRRILDYFLSPLAKTVSEAIHER